LTLLTFSCPNHQFSAGLLDNIFKPQLVKLNLKADRYATFILETTATSGTETC